MYQDHVQECPLDLQTPYFPICCHTCGCRRDLSATVSCTSCVQCIILLLVTTVEQHSLSPCLMFCITSVEESVMGKDCLRTADVGLSLVIEM